RARAISNGEGPAKTGARGRTRTCTALRPGDFKSPASAHSATRARGPSLYCPTEESPVFHGKKVVVVMPAYNAARTIEQTYREIPMDLVDAVVVTADGGTPATGEAPRRPPP